MCGLLLEINCTEKVKLDPEKWSSVDFLWLWKSAAIEIFNYVTQKKISSQDFWLWKIAAPEFVWPRKKCSSREFYHSPELRALWEWNPRKQSKQTPFQLWKFCNMKTVTNWTEARNSLNIKENLDFHFYLFLQKLCRQMYVFVFLIFQNPWIFPPVVTRTRIGAREPPGGLIATSLQTPGILIFV